MAGTKRTSSGEGASTRARKAAKTSNGESNKGAAKKGKGKGKAVPPATFKTQALPIHVNFTHTPAAVITNEEEPTASSDPGHIANATLLPTEFSTGSYGWKGARRITIELQGAEGKKEKVQVMININATVVGSKGAKDEEGAGGGAGGEAEEAADASEGEDAEE